MKRRLRYISLFPIIPFFVFAQSESVKPGINDPYLNPDLQVEEWVERFEREGREVYDNRSEIVNRIGLEPGMAVADVGAGTGLFLPLLAKGVGEEGTVYAIEIVPKFVEHVDTLAKENHWANVETVLCTERSIELPSNSIDVAYICDVYHHFEYPMDSLASIHTALKPGGQIIMIDFKRIPGVSSDWILDHMRAGQEVFEQEITSAGFQKVEEIDDLLRDNYMLRFQKQSL